MAENYKRTTGKYHYPKASNANYAQYGLVYSWPTAVSNGFCPAGWRLPTRSEFEDLITYVGPKSIAAADNLRATIWNSGKDAYGFGALPAGACAFAQCFSFGLEGNDGSAYFWSSDAVSSSKDYAYVLYVAGFADIDRYSSTNDITAFYASVRCIKK